MPDPLQLLREANPRTRLDFDADARRLVATLAATASSDRQAAGVKTVPSRRRRWAPRLVAAAAAAVVAAVVGVNLGGQSHPAPAAAQAMELAAARTATAADQSGTAEVRVTHGGAPWSGATIAWNGDDLSVTQQDPARAGRPGSELRVVAGTMYGIEKGNWVVLGDPANIDRGTGETPADYLAAVRADTNGTSLRRIIDGMHGLTTEHRADGSTVYRGSVPAGVVAPDTGYKDGQTIRMLPFGYVAHDEAADPNAMLNAAITVGAGGVVRSITVIWGANSTAWAYQVTYSNLGATPSPEAPAGARPLRELLRR